MTQRHPQKIIITGGAGFIGSACVRKLLQQTNIKILNIDKLTYAGDLSTLGNLLNHPNHIFHKTDICDSSVVTKLVQEFQPDAILHLAAESHVDRSIDAPDQFIKTNILGTHTLVEIARHYWQNLSTEKKNNFVFHHVSTDEVYGSLSPTDPQFSETNAYRPNSPYSASKASSDHLVRAWNKTFGLPIVLTNCSNNYGPYQFPEKLIPLMIYKCLHREELPVYGSGENIRDWLFVEDHADALFEVLTRGRIGQTYNIGGNNEVKNIDVVKTICTLLDELAPSTSGANETLIRHVTDRPGHDARYAIDAAKISSELGWQPRENFKSGLKKTIEWYLNHQPWIETVMNKNKFEGQRLGVKTS